MSSNIVYMILILKIGGVIEFKNFRLISMVGVVYKIIVKFFVNFFKRVMGSLIGEV